jgi:bifunctional UDP-N-acetylglucosamine pyrophosphorylase/glucosamine-1-phosphate N-acetyltransferase
MGLSIVILAAGEGKRMRSERPKVLHTVGGRPLIDHVVDTSRSLVPEQIVVVVGHRGDQVREALADHSDLHFVTQGERLGTGHALAQARQTLVPENDIFVLYGDVPLIREQTLARVHSLAEDCSIALLSFRPADPFGYGRIVRGAAGEVQQIIEQKDLDSQHHGIGECNTGIMQVHGAVLWELLEHVGNENAQGEYYLTDIVGLAVNRGLKVAALSTDDTDEVLGVNDQHQLAAVEREYRRRAAASLLDAGVKLYDPDRVDLRGQILVGRDVEIDVNVVLIGRVRLGDGVRIGAHCVIRDCILEAGATVHPHSVLEQATLGPGSEVGPFARLRPGARLEARAKVGNFVEVKQSTIGRGSKVNHLSYVGDTEMGKGVNVGAGTITCNYDGARKHPTVIEDDVFIGSDTQLVAPVRVGARSTIGAGSTITRDVPADKLTLSRAPQKTIEGWSRPVKPKKDR